MEILMLQGSLLEQVSYRGKEGVKIEWSDLLKNKAGIERQRRQKKSE